jgi:hypothetical protein
MTTVYNPNHVDLTPERDEITRKLGKGNYDASGGCPAPNGCEQSLTCPRPVCKWDDPRAARLRHAEERDATVVSIWKAHGSRSAYHVLERVASASGISVRSVQRITKRYKEGIT